METAATRRTLMYTSMAGPKIQDLGSSTISDFRVSFDVSRPEGLRDCFRAMLASPELLD